MTHADSTVLRRLFPKEIYITKETNKDIRMVNLEGGEDRTPKLVFLLKDRTEFHISKADHELVSKMADWIGLERKEVSILNIAVHPVTFLFLRNHYHIENLICFGISPTEIGMQLEHENNRVFLFMNTKIIFAPALDQVQKNEVSKKEFFYQVGIMFNRNKEGKL